MDNQTGDVRYIYHGNDGTGLPWNDTAQIDFLNPQAREAVIQEILHVAQNFPIIRFDAAMVLAKNQSADSGIRNQDMEETFIAVQNIHSQPGSSTTQFQMNSGVK